MHRELLSVLFVSLIALSSSAEESRRTLKEGGIWESTKPPKVKVKLDPASQGVREEMSQGVHVSINNKGSDRNPSSIGINFVDSKGKKTYVELKAVDPMKDPAQYEGSSSATPRASSQSFIGFELRIPFGSTQSTVLKSEDLDRQPVE
ncbi:MAG: hypothetical protein ABIQ95_15280 [Bdellovibrionia bacterium]